MINAKDYKILVVDDDPDLLTLTEKILTKTGYIVSLRQTGADALESIDMFRPDLMLLDVRLPDISGTEICTRIKSSPEFNHIHVILLSGVKTQPDHVADGLNTGADGYMLKPVNSRELIARVEAACRIIHSEKLARESERKFRNLFEHSLTGISMTSFDGKMAVNNAFANILGYEIGELVQKHFSEITHPDDVENDLEKGRQLREGECDSARWEKRYICKDGRIIWVDITATLGKDENGKPQNFITAILDITQRKLAEKALEQSEAMFRSLFNTMAEGVALHELIFDEAGKPADYRILNVNPSFSVQTGIPIEKAIMTTATELYGSPPPFLDHYSNVASSGNPFSFEVFYDKLDKYFSISVSSPGKGKFVTIFQDITSRKLAEQSLRQSEEAIRELNQHLEKRVEERTSELLLANKELEAFAYTISHDLRAPVRAISGFTKILEEDYLPQLNAEGQRVFRVIAENTRKMDQLIDDLLSFSRLSRAEMNLANVNMKDIIMHCFLEQTNPETRQKIGFKVSDFPLIRGDHAMLTQVWTNLISNAIKFTSLCQHPVISIEGHQINNEFVYFIQDNGTGFNMHYVDKLFGVFQRLHSVKDYEGTGVGLAIVQRVILRHGGRIWAEGEVGKGAKFSFTLKPEEFHPSTRL